MTTTFEFLKQFPDDDTCLNHLLKVRFGGTPTCPKCGVVSKFYRIRKEPAYVCGECGHHIHPMAGTLFERSRTPLQKWFYAMHLFTMTRHGVSAKEIQRQIGVTYKTAWRIGHEIRKHMARVDGDPMLGGHVQVDETMVGGKRSGGRRGRGAPGKTVVFGMLERDGDVMTRVVPNDRRATLEPHILTNVEADSIVSSDELKSCASLSKHGYLHGSVNHSAEEWVSGIHHTNSIEGFWSMVKHSIRSTHIHASLKHLNKYLGEYEFHFNRRSHSETMLDRLLAAF
jgi:transposase-like protein